MTKTIHKLNTDLDPNPRQTLILF